MFHVGRILALCRGFQQTAFDFHPSSAQQLISPATNGFVGILNGTDDVANAGLNHSFRARRGAPMMGARLQRHI
jgi:hypothetical protein